MKQCWSSRRIKIEIALSGAEIVLAVGLWIWGGIHFLRGELSYYLIIILGGYACFVLGYCLLNSIAITTKYKVSSDGIIRRYLDFYTVEYLWSEVSDISVCDVAHNRKNEKGFDIVIRIVVGKEKNGPLNEKCPIDLMTGMEKWRDNDYQLIHMKQVMLIEYSKDKYDEIKKASGREIVDRRTRRGKKREIEM